MLIFSAIWTRHCKFKTGQLCIVSTLSSPRARFQESRLCDLPRGVQWPLPHGKAQAVALCDFPDYKETSKLRLKKNLLWRKWVMSVGRPSMQCQYLSWLLWLSLMSGKCGCMNPGSRRIHCSQIWRQWIMLHAKVLQNLSFTEFLKLLNYKSTQNHAVSTKIQLVNLGIYVWDEYLEIL